MPGYVYGRTEKVLQEVIDLLDKRSKLFLPGSRIGPQRSTCFFNGSIQHCRRSVVEWMRKTCWGVNPFHAMLRKRQASEERRSDSQGVDGGTDVVEKARQGQFRRSRTTSDGLPRFQNADRMARASDLDSCREAIWTAADNDRIKFHRLILRSGQAWHGGRSKFKGSLHNQRSQGPNQGLALLSGQLFPEVVRVLVEQFISTDFLYFEHELIDAPCGVFTGVVE